MNSVSEATKPAADGIGKPRKSFEGTSRIADRQLNRARRNAPHSRYTEAMNQPASGCPSNTSLSTTRCTRKAGAAPNEIRSASESNSRPNGLSTRSEEHTSELQSLRHLVC